MTDSISFTYRRTRQSAINIFFLLLLTFTFGCFFSLIGTLLAASLAEKLLAQELPKFTVLYVFIASTIGYLLLEYWRRLETLSLENDILSWRPGLKKEQSIPQGEIKSAKIYKGSLIINDNIKIFVRSLPQKTQIEFVSILPSWLPETALSKEWKAYLHGKEQLRNEWEGKETFSLSASTNAKKATWIRRIGGIGLIFLVLVIGTIIAFNLPESISSSLVWLLIPLVFLFLYIWQITKYRRIQVNEAGITYQHGKKELFWPWGDIEVVAFRANSEEIVIWQGPRYKSYSYKRIRTEDMNAVANTIFQQAMIRHIPVTWV
ncbi:MAG: hypothetical protein CL608_28580 [Anaerolineaceae bacterium]|nr:hypothetical protein [Anaerolineaceae bacterium]